jgi:uncharacterized protein with PQ loop repeat
VPNGIGILAGLYSAVSYQRFSINIPVKLYIIASFIVSLALKLALSGDFKSIGLIGCALAVVLSGSPLVTVGTVLREKSTASLPFNTSLTTWLNALTWLLYGSLIAKDYMIYLPNGFGFLLATIQMALFGIFGIQKSS